MSQIREIKRRIKSVNNIAHVTHAMQLVAASRMRRAQDNAQRGRAYSDKVKEILLRVTTKERINLHPLLDLEFNQSAAVMLVVFAPQRGLAGSLPGNLIRFVHNLLKNEKGETQIISVGKKIRTQLLGLGYHITADFSEMPEMPTTADIRPILKMIQQSYLEQEVGRVVIVYPRFINAVSQQPIARVLLPLDITQLHLYGEKIAEISEQASSTFVFEPNKDDITDELVPSYLESQIYQAKLETVACEYSARMVAMKNATDNAYELKNLLTLEFNKSRQAQITAELAEISAGGL